MSINLEFTVPTKREWVRHSYNTRSIVMRNIVCNGVRIGLIFRLRLTDKTSEYVAWWKISHEPVRTTDMKIGSYSNTVRGAINSASRRIRSEIQSAILLAAKLPPKSLSNKGTT